MDAKLRLRIEGGLKMVKCYSVLYSIVEESNTLFTDKWPSFEALNWISGVCEMIDTVAKLTTVSVTMSL